MDLYLFQSAFKQLYYSLIKSSLHPNYKYLSQQLQMQDQEERQYVNEYTLLYLLGQGGQASVFLGKKEGQIYALKVYFPGQNKRLAYEKEVSFLGKVNHPNLINMIAYFPQAQLKLKNHTVDNRPLIVLEYAEGGQLYEYLEKTGQFPAKIVRFYAKSIINGLKYLYENNIAHRDLKPQNLLFDSRFNIKIADFGLARDARGNNNDFQLKSCVGTQGYQAPELFQHNYEGASVDLFATGVILFNMFTKRPPFQNTTSCKFYNLIKNNKYEVFWKAFQKLFSPNFFPQSFKRLIFALLSADPRQRPSLNTILQNEWLNQQEDLSSEQVQNFMFGRYTDLNKTKQKKEIVRPIGHQKQYRNNIDLQNLEVPSSEVFAYWYDNLVIIQKQLPIYTVNRLHYSSDEPKVLVAWIQTYLREKFIEKETFLQGSIEQINPVNYSVEFLSDKNQIQINLSFQINFQEESQGTELVLIGQLHQCQKGRTGIQWKKISGNSFWLYKVIAKLNEQLESL